MEKKNIAILGSTGSIGQQALEVIRQSSDRFAVSVLTANDNAQMLIEQALEFRPRAVVIGNEEHLQTVRSALALTDTTVDGGRQALADVVAMEEVDRVLTATVGISGLAPTLNAIRHGKTVLLANKETLAVAGRLITDTVKQHGTLILPVDSEHSAVFQCLAGEKGNTPEKIYLTASGGPFRGMTSEQLRDVSREEALRHPNWDMGDKISIDSATMMNKGLEMMEACWLFDVTPAQVEVVIHPQSVIHSMVQFADGSIKAQMGLPDMKQAIHYALGYPVRFYSDLPRLGFDSPVDLHLERAGRGTFRCLDIAYEAMEAGGTMPCIVNAANEEAVSAFLEGRLTFLAIPHIISLCMESVSFSKHADIDTILECDRETRAEATRLIKTIRNKER